LAGTFGVLSEFAEFGRIAMSAWFRDDDALRLTESAAQIALDYLDRAGEIDDRTETREFVINKLQFLIGQGQRNKLLLANRAIAAFQHYREARTIELSLICGCNRSTNG
jgi:hypothetical protein